MKILIAPDKFKGCLSAPEVAAALATGIHRVLPHATLDLCPLADGGEGTVDALVAATAGQIHHATVTGPLPGTTVHARYGILGGKHHPPTAVIEMAAAAGLALLPPADQNPLHTTTYGVGQLIRSAFADGARKIILGIGGSATTDGGVGCAQGAGGRVWIDTNPRSRSRFNLEEALPIELTEPFTGRDLAAFHSVMKPDLGSLEIIVACDVTNPLHGPNGGARIYGPQKGATPEMVEILDKGLERLAVRTRQPDLAEYPGAGAAGGLGFGMVAFFGARLARGIEIVMDAVQLRQRLAGADLCITGEGRLDSQSLSGKAPTGVARACADAGVPCVAVAGSVAVQDEPLRAAGIHRAYEIGTPDMTTEQRIRQARELLLDAGEQVARDLASARGNHGGL